MTWLTASLLACTPTDEPGIAPGRSGLVPLQDLDPADGRFQGELVAAPASIDVAGEPTELFAYEGRVPGPLIRTAVGDEVEVRFVDELPDGFDSSVHWHGIEGYNAADGTPVTAELVPVGGETTYRFRTTRPGTYWYHPHHRGAQTVFAGLYGVLVVDQPEERELVDLGVLPATEHVLVLSDTSTFDGQVSSAESDSPMEIMNGTEGEHLLVDGRVRPSFDVPAGDGARLRVLNTSITRFWRLHVDGHPLLRVGGEGGLSDRARLASAPGFATPPGDLVLAPGERAEVVLKTDGDAVGDVLALRWEDVARGRHGMWMEGDEMVMGDLEDDGQRPGVEVATFRLVSGGGASSVGDGDPLLAALGETTAELPGPAAVTWTGASALTLDERMDMWQDDDGVWQMSTWFGIDGVDWPMSHHGGPDQPLAPNARHARLGDTIDLEVHNTTGMAHPFHLHGFSYQPLSLTRWPDPEAGETGPGQTEPWPEVELEDTTAIPGFSSLFLRVRLDDPEGDGSAAGRWMVHCHLLQHGENGMMSELVVEP